MTVVKMRRSQHSKDLREYEMTAHGLEIGEPLTEYEGIITGVARLREHMSAREPDA